MSAQAFNFKHTRIIALLLVLAFAGFGGLAGLALAGPAEAPAAVQAALAPETDALGPNAEAEVCAACHKEVVDGWSTSRHQQAFTNEHFQEGWDSVDFDPQCLDCHTTGFSPATGEYKVEGVSCTACHGEIAGDHPLTPADLSIANTVCKDCHTVTYAEFRASLHEDTGLECTSCHYAHNNGLRLETELAQCLNCHGNQLDDFAHDSHVNTAGLVCRDCHGYVEPGQPIPINGLAPTGHDFQANLTACLDCHEDIQLAPVNDGTGDGFSREAAEASFVGGEESALRIRELESAVESLTLQNRNSRAIFALEGAVGGLVIGGVVIWLLGRRKRTSLDDDGAEHE